MGSLCEALLFFSKTHLVIDFATAARFGQKDLLDDLIEMLKEGYLTANYAPEAVAVHTDKRNGLSEHRFDIFRFSGSEESGHLKRNVDVLEIQLARALENKAEAKRYHRDLCKLITFKELNESNTRLNAVEDISDQSFSETIARMNLESYGVPPEEIQFSYFGIMRLEEGKFTVVTDLDFDRLRKFVPEDLHETFGRDDLFSIVGDARLDILIAAKHNAAFVGNDENKFVIEKILTRALGAVAGGEEKIRSIYDFISVDTPSIREVINSGARSPREFIKLASASGAFKRWLGQQSPDADLVREMLREKAATGWMETVPVKAARFSFFTAGGLIADLYAPGSSVALGAVDTFLLEKLAKHWRPHFFIENQLKGFLDLN